jgi:hypothetical protein
MAAEARAVGRLGDGSWVGFAAGRDGYRLVVGGTRGRVAVAVADSDDLLALAIAYFDEDLGEPPEELAATYADVSALLRHLLAGAGDRERAKDLQEAIDAVDDGLGADVVVARLVRCATHTEEPAARLVRRASRLAEGASG